MYFVEEAFANARLDLSRRDACGQSLGRCENAVLGSRDSDENCFGDSCHASKCADQLPNRKSVKGTRESALV